MLEVDVGSLNMGIFVFGSLFLIFFLEEKHLEILSIVKLDQARNVSMDISGIRLFLWDWFQGPKHLKVASFEQMELKRARF